MKRSISDHRGFGRSFSLWMGMGMAFLAALIVLFTFNPFFTASKDGKNAPTERERYENFLTQHPFSTTRESAFEEGKSKEDPGPAVQQDFLATMDPSLKRPTPEVLPKILKKKGSGHASRAGSSALMNWTDRGPDNVGGRTRAIMFDPNDPSQEKVWAGGVTGGLWYNNDITHSDSSWHKVNDFWANLAVTCIAHDPNDPQTFYVGTGEDFYAGSSRGAGIWKSTDGGQTWSQLSSTTDLYYVNDIVVRNESGTSAIYAAVSGANYKGVTHLAHEGLQRSTDGGNSWSQVMPNAPNGNPYSIADLELGSDGRIWAGTQINSHSGGIDDRGGGRIFYSDDGVSWTGNVYDPSSTNSRVEIATAPSDPDRVYGIMAGQSLTDVDTMIYTSDHGATWNGMKQPNDADNGIPADDFSRGQAFYDLIIQVDPNDANTIYAGAINLHKSTDAGASWTQISKWSNNANMDQLNCSMVHADQHQIIFRDGNSNEAVFGTDGGVFYSNSLDIAGSNDVIHGRRKNYRVTQYYAAAMHPGAGVNDYIAGSQDNGTQRYTSPGMNSTTEISGGDGAYCFYDKGSPQYMIVSIYYNSYYLLNSSGGLSFVHTIVSDQSSGNFINAADYDDNLNILYSGKNDSRILRVKNVLNSPSSDSLLISGMGSMASAFEVSPHTTSSTTLFVGTEAGRLFRVDQANSFHTTTELTSSSFPTGNISSIEVGTDENELLVTFSNYGVNSVWYSDDGGSTWTNKEGDLPNMPVRWGLFGPRDSNRVFLATEIGVWRTDDLSANSPTWVPSDSGLGNVRVDMLRKRESDGQLIAATYGRGLFSGTVSTGCSTPLAQASSLVTNAQSTSQIDGHFDTSSAMADGYLVVRNTTDTLTSLPTDGNSYSNGDALGGGTVVKASSDTSFSAQSLSSNTLYYFFIFAYNDSACAGGPQYKTPALTGYEATERNDGLCVSIGHPGSDEHISSVSVNNLDHSTSKEPGGFGDHSNLSTDLSRSDSYNLEVAIDTDGDSTYHVGAWIDWDQDQDFQDADEHFDLGQATNSDSAVLNKTISVPSNATLGSTLLRISQDHASAPAPCTVGLYGETEEYSVKVTKTSSLSSHEKELVHKLYPNPNDGTFTLSTESPVELSIHDVKGKMVMAPTRLAKGVHRFQKDLGTGIYYLKLEGRKKTRVRKMLVR